MRIGELARHTGFTIDTLRYYDRIGLLRPARRNPVSGFREYGADASDYLALVRSAKAADLSLPQIRKILAAARTGSACREVVPLLDRKVREVDEAIEALRTLRARLVRALKTGFPKRAPKGCTCPILLGLSKRKETP